MNPNTTHLAPRPSSTSLMRLATLALAACCLMAPPSSSAEASIDELLEPRGEAAKPQHRPQPHYPQSSHNGDIIAKPLEMFFESGCDPRAFLVIGGVFAAVGAYELFVPLDWMHNGTVSDYLNRSPSTSTEGDGSIWPFGFGFLLDSQFPGEASSVALADVGVFTVRHANVYGVQACGLKAAVTDDCAGLSVGGLFAAAENVYGIQVGGLLSSCRSDIYGIQVAGYANDTPGICAGMQAGIVNMAGDVYGAQIGFTNRAGDVNGMQIGVVNVAQNMRGVQIGLVNVIKDNGVLPVSMLFNARF